MHRVLLHEAVIDVPSGLVDATRDFWSAALAATPHRLDGYTEFTDLQHAASLAALGIQDIGDGPARVHLDIETDDLEAEVARLVGLGAREVARPHSWVVLADPAGLLFCVLPQHSPDFESHARTVG